jgi:putative tryptophan/tyrosine transport system substrate-binding protein
LLASSALASAPRAWGQASRKVTRIGAPFGAPRRALEHLVEAFESGMRDYGYVNGRDVVLEYRFGDGDMSRMPELIRELLGSKVDILVTGTNPTTTAAKAQTGDIPIVMWVGTDVVGQGYVASLARPGGNVTGLTWDVGGEVVGKRLQLLKEAVPGITRVAGVYDAPYEEAPVFRDEMQKVASGLGIDLVWQRVPDDLEGVFASIVRARADAIFPTGGGWMFVRRREIAELAAKHRIAASYYDAAFVDVGGLMSYAPNLPGLIRGTWKYIDRLIKGAKAGDLPVEQPTRLDFVMNLKAAKALSLTIPRGVLLRADRVIQ